MTFREKLKKDRFVLFSEGKVLDVNEDAYNYLMELKDRLEKLEYENKKLVNELGAIKPVLATEGMKPAVHISCGGCRFVVRSKWNGDIIGCNKDCVCRDFYPKEEE